jgi:3-deoxy-D-manno-octulosonic acid kinase
MSRRWPVGPEVSEVAIAGGRMLYDASRASNFTPEYFDPKFWRERDALEGTARGRGTTWFIKSGSSQLVLRHYRRGGLAAKISEDRYWWREPQLTRPFHEWYLTYHMRRAGLPVPVPVAARYVLTDRTYTGDLITERIEGSESLAARLARGSVPFTLWIALGRCIRRFHVAGICHADLNAHNILLVGDNVHVIDFDRGELRKPGWWSDANLVRLHRSLEKVTLPYGDDRFSDDDWHSLLAGYREAPVAHPAVAA